MLQFYLDAGLVAIYTVAVTCVGMALLGALRRNDDISYPALLASAFFLGQGILSNIWLLISLTGHFTPWVVLAVLGGGVVVGGRSTAAAIGGLGQSLWAFTKEQHRETWAWKAVAGATLLLMLATLGRMLITPISGDAIAFYLALPKLIAHEHAMTILPTFEGLCTICLQGEMHWAGLFLLGTGPHAVWFSLPVAAGTAWLLLNMASLAGVGRRGQWIILTMLFTSTTFTYYVGDGKVDLFGAGLGLACCYWVLQAGRLADPRRCLLLAGAFAGLAVTAKISLLVVLAPAAGVLLLWHAAVRTEPPTCRTDFKSVPPWITVTRRCASAVLLVTLSALAMLIPHFIKNALLFGEPFAPFLTLHGQASHITSQRWFSPETTAEIVAVYPLALVFGRYPMMGGTLSPLLLMVAPLVIFPPQPASWRRSVLCQIACLGVIGLAAWLIVRPSVVAPRYILPPLFLLMIPVARGAEWACSRPDRNRLVTFACIGGILFVSGIYVGQAFGMDNFRQIKQSWKKITYALRGVSYQDDDGYGRACAVINQRALETDRVFVGAYYTYWLRDDLLAKLNGANETNELSMQSTIQARWDFLHRQGFRLIVLDCNTHPWLAKALGVNIQTGDLESTPEGLHVEKCFQETNLAAYELRAVLRDK